MKSFQKQRPKTYCRKKTKKNEFTKLNLKQTKMTHRVIANLIIVTGYILFAYYSVWVLLTVSFFKKKNNFIRNFNF